MHCLHPLTAGIHCFPLRNFSLWHVLLLLLCLIPVPHVSSVSAAQMMPSVSSPVIVLPMIRRRHTPTPGLMLLSFYFNGTSRHTRRVDMYVIVWNGVCHKTLGQDGNFIS